MSGDDYELVSRAELDELRREVADIKKHPMHEYESSVSVIEAMDRLTSQVAHLVRIFEHANKELYDEYSKGFHDESKKLDKLIEQNEKMARGILAVADLVQNKPAPPTPTYPLQTEAPTEPIPRDPSRPANRRIVNEFR